MKIGIEINGVLRNTLDKVGQTYKKVYLEKTDGLEEEDNFNYEIIEPIESLDLKKHLTFKTDTEQYTFLYEEFSMEIFGHASSTETMSFNYLNDFYLDFRTNHDIFIISDEIGRSKPASLFFLSKFGCLIENYIFYNTYTLENTWKNIDILITANPDLLLNYPKGKEVIKFNTEYNKEIKSKYEITSLKELNEKLKEIYGNV